MRRGRWWSDELNEWGPDFFSRDEQMALVRLVEKLLRGPFKEG